MAAYETGLVARSKLPDHRPSTNISAKHTVLKDQILPAKHNLYPRRTLSIPSLPTPTSSLLPSRTFLSGAGRYEWVFCTSSSVGQTQMRRIFQRAKKKVSALFSPKQTPPPDESPTSQSTYASELWQRRRAELIPVPGRANKFGITHPPAQRTRDRAERKMLRRMSPRTRERRSVTTENTRKMLELEEERIAVRDFEPEHKAVREEKMDEAKEEAKRGAPLEEQD